MPIDALLQRLTAETEARAGQRVAAARAEAARLVGEAEAAWTRRGERELAERARALQTEADRLLAQARRRAVGQRLSARHRAVERSFERAAGLLAERAAAPEIGRATVRAVQLALDALGGRAAVIRCPADAADLVRDSVSQRSDLSLEIDSTVGPGALVIAADGKVTVDARLATELARLRPALAIAIARELENEE